MDHPRRQIIASVLLLLAIGWGLVVWLGMGDSAGSADLRPSSTISGLDNRATDVRGGPVFGPWLVYHRIGAVLMAAALTIYLFLTSKRTGEG